MGLRFRPVTDGEACDKQDGHGGKDRPAVPGRASHLAQGDGERRGNEKDQFDFNEVAEGRGIFKGVPTIGVEEAAAIGAQFLDYLLGSDRALRDDLGRLPMLPGGHGGIGLKVLDHSLADQYRRYTRQMGSRIHRTVRVVSTQKLPMVADCLRAMPRTRATATAMPMAALRKL